MEAQTELPAMSPDAKAGRSVIFCATQRTGSAMVCDDYLALLGHWGLNAEIVYDTIIRKGSEAGWPQIWEDLKSRFTVRGVIALKMMFHYTPYISHYMGGVKITRKRPILEFKPEDFGNFHRFFKSATWVHIWRRDVFLQAVSMYFAEQTGLWESRGAPPAPAEWAIPPYDYAALMALARAFRKERRQWELFFAHFGITPLNIDYEDAVDRYPFYLAPLLDELGFEPVEPTPPRRFFKVGGKQNAEFAARLRKDAQAERDYEALL